MSTPKIILGLSYSHGDSSAALIVENRLVAACEEERLNRIKHYALFPERAVQFCLKQAQIDPAAVTHVAIAKKPFGAWRQKLHLLLENPQLAKSKKVVKSENESLTDLLKKVGIRRAKVARVEHHFAHLMSARYLSSDEKVAVLSIDGLGDFASAALGFATGNKLEVLKRIYFPHSLGYFYTAMTQYLGFPHYGDEFKVMGLSAYGQPSYLPGMRELIREGDGFSIELNLEAFPILREPMRFVIENGQTKIFPFYSTPFLTQITGIAPRKSTEPLNRKHWDLAKSVQARFEEVANHLVNHAAKNIAAESLALAGGCAHNSVWVGKIKRHTPFKNVFVAPAAHDGGIAVGAAIAVAQSAVVPDGNSWALLGPDVSEQSLSTPTAPFAFKETQFDDDDKLLKWLVEEIKHEKIVGLAHGRLEFGPRALGSRSILCDPRSDKMRHLLNARVKHRELFRPFAASVLWEHQEKWFVDSFYSPTMEAVFEVKADVRHRIPAVVHVDNTCRIQSVRKEIQPFFWALLERFHHETGIPLLLNTSFNDCEPIVCTAQDAWNCFSHCDMDHLVLGRRVFSRSQSALALTG